MKLPILGAIKLKKTGINLKLKYFIMISLRHAHGAGQLFAATYSLICLLFDNVSRLFGRSSNENYNRA